MRASGVWFGNDQWPAGSSPGAFARDVFRIENCKTDRDKALAFYTWFQRCMCRGPNLKLPGLGTYVHCSDPTLLFTSWGHNECTGWGWVAAEALQSAGLKARRVAAFQNGHTFYEVWYKGLDGRESWHAFDPFIGWYFTNEAGEVASCEELAAKPDLVTNPRPGGPTRLGNHPERSGVLHRYQVHDALDVVQPPSGRELRYDLRAGQSFSNLWRPEVPELATTEKPGRGNHCDISMYDEDGRVRYPEHAPFWRHYMWPANDPSGIAGSQAVRWQGCGTMRWEPLRYGADATWSNAHAVFENDTVRPTGSRKHCEIWWHVRLPYLASWLRINSAFDMTGADTVGIAISQDAGKSLHPIYWKNSPPPKILTVSPQDVPGIRHLQEFWIRLDMSSQSPQPILRCRGFHIHAGYQVNMHALPRLLPGQNELYLQADRQENVTLNAEWHYTRLAHGNRREEEQTAALTLNPGDKTVRKSMKVDAERPDDLIMRGVRVSCRQAVR